MVRITADDHILRDINISEITTYLTRPGSVWEDMPCKNNRLRAFSGPQDDNGRRITVFLPAKAGFYDEKERIADTVNTVAVVEHVSPQRIIQQIHALYCDVIQVRLLTPDGIVPPLERALQILNGLKDLIYYGACMEDKPSAYIRSRRLKIGTHQLQSCNLGHTFTGSFGFRIEVPLSEQTLPGINDYVPLSRRVVERIMRGLSFAKEAEMNHNSEIMLNSFMEGLNSNMCRAVLNTLGNNSDLQMEFEVLWSSLIHPYREIEPVIVGNGTAKYLAEVANGLDVRSVDAKIPYMIVDETEKSIKTISTNEPLLLQGILKHQTIYGKVQKLSAESRDSRVATILAADGSLIEVPLEKKFYETAFNAHIEYLDVSITGDLKSGRETVLTNLTEFRIVH